MNRGQPGSTNYAFGEIALVVIGILIALQINNYNEWRKDRVIERKILVDLATNLEMNIGPANTQLTIFPDDSLKLISEAKKAGLDLDGPHPAILVQGDDKLGAFRKYTTNYSWQT